jgi:hypothetical protein
MKTLFNQQDRAEVLERLRKIRPENRGLWGKMTAHQMVCHLSDSFKAATGEKAVSPASNLFNRVVIKWVALRAPITWPKGVKTRPEMDQQGGGTSPVEFELDVKELEKMVDRFTQKKREFEWHPHPIFGDMTDEEWLRWGYLHMDHHLRQFGA